MSTAEEIKWNVFAVHFGGYFQYRWKFLIHVLLIWSLVLQNWQVDVKDSEHFDNLFLCVIVIVSAVAGGNWCIIKVHASMSSHVRGSSCFVQSTPKTTNKIKESVSLHARPTNH